MDGIFAEWLKNPTVVGATTLLMVAVYALWKGLVVSKWVYDDKAADCLKLEKHRDELLELLLRQQTVTTRAVTALTEQPKQ